ncbi:uncharacterized protein [Physcomitrium patens]|uniref:uncharacterized protein isoform X4 n=1 Tax=Physcomitrium patens TaxID=3218 RepID=UPI003CCD54ED
MALASLIPHHVFGVRSTLKNSLFFVDETTVAYPAGHNLVFWNLDTRTQKIISGSPEMEGISAIALSPNKKQIAIAERVYASERMIRVASPTTQDPKPTPPPPPEQRYPMISIYDTVSLRKKKVLSSTDIGSKEYVSITYTSDTRMIAAQGGGPEWNLVTWSIDKQKIIASVKVSPHGAEAHQVLCCPQNPALITSIGVGFARTFKATETQIRPVSTGVSKKDGATFVCHVWLEEKKSGDEDNEALERESIEQQKDGTCIYAIDSGEILLVDGGEIVNTIGTSVDALGIVEAIVQYSKGFICGERMGVVSLYEKAESGEFHYKKTNQIKMENEGVKVSSLAMSPNEDWLVCIMENGQLISFPFQNLDMVKPNEVPKDIIVQAFHTSTITGMDMCTRKPLIATSSLDKTVKIWNYITKTLELVGVYPEDALSIAMHPNGLHVLVGFADKLRFMNLLMDDLKTIKEFNVKGCNECCFSTGGQYFAAVHSNAVHVFETYTCNNIGNLRAHSGKVRSLAWSFDDCFLLTAGVDGAIYEWELKTLKRVRENVIKGCQYSGVVSVRDSKTFFAVGSDRKLKELDDALLVRSYTSAVALTQIKLPFASRLLFAGTDVGSVRAYKFPLSGEDGSIVLFDIHNKERSVVSSARKDKDALGWAKEVLIYKADMEEMHQTCQDLESKVVQISTYCDYQLKIKDQDFNDWIKESNEQHQHELEASRIKLQTMLQQKAEDELEQEKKLLLIEEQHAQVLQDVEAQFHKRMLAEVERYQALEQEKILSDAKWQDEITVAYRTNEKAMQDLIEAYEDKLDGEKEAYQQLKKDKEQSYLDFAEVRRQHEFDQDQELEEIKASFEVKLSAEKDTLLRIKGENGILNKKMSEFSKDIEIQREELKLLFHQKKELYKIIGIFERDMIALRKDIEERNETITEKERRIYDLKRKNQELEKFKFVLDYKIKDLKQQIGPREVELQDTRDIIQKMEKELQRTHKSLEARGFQLAEMKLLVEGAKKDQNIMRQKIADDGAMLTSFQSDFCRLTETADNAREAKEMIKRMYEKYIQNKFTPKELDNNILNEYARQRMFLERKVDNLSKKLFQQKEIYKEQHAQILEQNNVLIKAYHELQERTKGKHFDKSQDDLTSKSNSLTQILTQEIPSMKNSDIEKLQDYVKNLEQTIDAQAKRIQSLEDMLDKSEKIEPRPQSKQKLPSLDL